MKLTSPRGRRASKGALIVVAALGAASLTAAHALLNSDGTVSLDDTSPVMADVSRSPAEHASPPVPLVPPASSAEAGASTEPRAWLEPAPLLEFPADPDCNSPCFWHKGELHLFTSNQKPSRSVGPDLERLGAPVPSVFDDGARKLRWIEAVHLREDGTLFGLYHREEYLGECPDRAYFTVPDIGVARSRDLGRTWTDLGIVLQDRGVSRSCDTPNKFFAGGVGDPSWAIDRAGRHAYIFFSSYTDPLSNQGVQVARLALGNLEAPVGKVWRWSGRGWDAPGLGGKGKPAVPARVRWSDPRADAFWGPSVHWNTYLGQHVVLVNRASDASWTQEGVYVFFVKDLSRPETFTPPRKLHDGGAWYCQVIGDAAMQGTDSLAGRSARFFMKGKSRHRVVFERPAAAGVSLVPIPGVPHRVRPPADRAGAGVHAHPSRSGRPGWWRARTPPPSELDSRPEVGTGHMIVPDRKEAARDSRGQ